MPKREPKGKHRAFQRRSEPGAPPGTLSVDPSAPKPRVQVMAYGPDDMIEEKLEDPEKLRSLLEKWQVCWINVDGFGDVGLLERLAAVLGVHQLALEVEAAQPGQAHVEHEAARPIGPRALEEVPRRREDLDGQPHRREQAAQGVADGLIVVDHEDDRLARARVILWGRLACHHGTVLRRRGRRERAARGW